MKNRLLRITFTIIVFGAVWLSLACPNGPQNSNQNQIQNNQTNVQNNQPATESEEETLTAVNCSNPNTGQKIKDIKAKIEGKINGNTPLKYQYAAKKFEFDLKADSNNDIILTLKGKVVGDENALKNFGKIFEGSMKKGCVQKISYGELGATSLADDFEWGLCEYPNQVCSDGECKPACPALTPDPKNTNSNTNSGN